MGDRERGARVYVGGLTESIKKEDLEEKFEKYGKLNSVWVAFNPPGFAFVEFDNTEDAETACDNLNETDFLGSKLRVEMARGKSRRGGFRGGRGGDRDFRGSRGGDRFGGGGYGGRRDEGGRFGGRDYGRRSDGGGYGSRDGGSSGGRSFNSDSRYRSRSPTGGYGRR